jgi:competence protein ComEC
VVVGEDGWSLVDCGARGPHWDAGEGAVLPVLRWAGVRELRLLALTHDDGDHTGGSDAVRRGVRVHALKAPAPRPGVPGPCVRFGASSVGAGDTLGRAPLMIARWPPWPGAPGEASVARRGDNAAALVLEVGDGTSRAWLMADADSVVEAQLSPRAPVALLKAGHHGSGSSSGAAFVARARPECVVLSVGARNVYGHPDAGAVRRLGQYGALLERTDRDGLLWYDLGPQGVMRLDWRRGEPWCAATLAQVRARGAWRPRAQP